jgi:hypothetical protein
MGKRPASGVEYLYEVKDGNFSTLNEWEFVVRVPTGDSRSIIVQPTRVPAKKVWADIERRSIVWRPATLNPYKKKVYCKVTLSDPTEKQNKVGLARGERDLLPPWFKKLRHRLRLKGTVTTSNAPDLNAQILLSSKANHAEMIRSFFALKVWVLQEGWSLL